MNPDLSSKVKSIFYTLSISLLLTILINYYKLLTRLIFFRGRHVES